MTPLTLPISEDFHSYQGEGQWTGTPMHFIRTAGCSVGKHPDQVTWEIGADRNFPILRTGRPAYRCHTYDGRGFWCDTDFQKSTPMTISELLDNTWEHHVCLTGGEPFMLKDRLVDFLGEAHTKGIEVHFETSGTIYWDPNAWVTVSPKQDVLETMINRADEIKLLVDEGFDYDKVPFPVRNHRNVFIQPVNDELHIDLNNLKRCHDVLRVRPDWRLSVQLHKCFGWR